MFELTLSEYIERCLYHGLYPARMVITRYNWWPPTVIVDYVKPLVIGVSIKVKLTTNQSEIYLPIDRVVCFQALEENFLGEYNFSVTVCN